MHNNRLSESEIMDVLDRVRQVFASEPIVVDVEAENVIFVGDIHGDIISATRLFRLYKNTNDVFVFLGDYVDRGAYSTEVIIGLFRLKISDPDRLILLRGNHETTLANEYYGFMDELLRKYPESGLRLYREFNMTFSQMPVAAIVNGNIFCVHGGIPKDYDLATIKSLSKGDIEGRNPLLLQVLWNDPDETIEYFEPSYRGPGIYLFGKKAFEDFMQKNELEFLIRAHTFLPMGAKWFFGGRLLSLFSPTEYVGRTLQPKIAKLKNNEIRVLDLTKLP